MSPASWQTGCSSRGQPWPLPTSPQTPTVPKRSPCSSTLCPVPSHGATQHGMVCHASAPSAAPGRAGLQRHRQEPGSVWATSRAPCSPSPSPPAQGTAPGERGWGLARFPSTTGAGRAPQLGAPQPLGQHLATVATEKTKQNSFFRWNVLSCFIIELVPPVLAGTAEQSSAPSPLRPATGQMG